MDSTTNRKIISSVTRSHADARRAYDRLSGIYDWLAASEAPFRRKAVEMLAIQPGERVLEVGCGTGEGLVQLARRSAIVTGIDLSPKMARRAAGKLAERCPGGSAQVGVGDAIHLPFESGSFDAVMMTFTLELFDSPEIPPVLDECRRVLREAGRLGIAALNLPDRPDWMVRIYEWFHQNYPAWADCRPIPAGDLVQASGFAINKEWRGSLWGLPVAVISTGKVQ